jgi:hypothetical protein
VKQIARIGVLAAFLVPPFQIAVPARAQTADQAWLKYTRIDQKPAVPLRVVRLGNSPLAKSAADELVRGLRGLYGSGELQDSVGSGAIVLGTWDEFSKKYAGWKPLAAQTPKEVVDPPPLQPEQLPLEALARWGLGNGRFYVHRNPPQSPHSIFIEAPCRPPLG